jgi:hypothetical protein
MGDNMTRIREQQTLLTLKDFLRQQLYDAAGNPVPPGVNRELARVVDHRLRDVWAQSAHPHVERLIEHVTAKTVQQITQDYYLVPKGQG